MSRFSPECGGRKLLQEELTFLMQIELPVVLIIIVTNILYLTIEIWLKILLITVLLLFAGLKKQKIINLKVIMVGYLVQCVTTAKDVKKENFLLAYTAAEEWLKVYEKN